MLLGHWSLRQRLEATCVFLEEGAFMVTDGHRREVAVVRTRIRSLAVHVASS